MELITGRRGFDHFSSAEFRQIMSEAFGAKTALFANLGKLEAEIVSNNLVKIKSL